MSRLPNSASVYERVGVGMHPLMQELGMARTPRVRFPSWSLPHPESGLTVFLTVQVDSKATDPYSGGGFRVEVERSTNRTPHRGLVGRALFFQLLTDSEMVPLLAQQNAVIRKLESPPEAQVSLYPGSVREQYLSYFEPQVRFDAIRCWLRYRDLDDIDAWVPTLAPTLGDLAERAATWLSPDAVSLGKGSLIPPG